MVEREVPGRVVRGEEDLFSVLVPHRIVGVGIGGRSKDVVTFQLDDGSRVQFESFAGWAGGSEILMSWFEK